ncbi:MAG: hypothetical protein UT48_C0010G0020 [Parcubacteria group bacterium GW2011_GWE2_39_37]|uniref:Metallo-beta-lactamase domain-containing protein n=1 Tax=Candidatus Falkowbacteria bacterium GW2011_GWF2_39_8 TaxID=1618642 RepID=A0A0G0PSL7_9BACT|nr:MAG: hypothetical protein UT48_C0010G0020 [Parcubacteria group bacterium GW2011_GWE2_39_37]KKR31149.1 MAG: hypothetical protein UT64_C0071G0003 [Candidatus Falkowbacteria bacterium GW2011_GWF2_39_8]
MLSDKQKIIFLAIACLVVVISAILIGFFYKEKDFLEIDFLDVGQGDSILIKAPTGQNILIDGGPDNSVLRRLSENLPWWDRQIDLMVLTHPHDDHVGGLIEVLKHYQIKRILYTGVVHSSPSYLAWLEQIKKRNVVLTIIDRPQTIYFSPDCKMVYISPQESLVGKSVTNLNNSSLIAKVEYKKVSALLVGDAEAEIEEGMMARGQDLSAGLIKIGHHGSDTASSEEFIRAVKPSFGVIQVGKDNSFGHPSKRTLKKLERNNVSVFRNDLQGTIRMSSKGDKWQIIP